MLQKWKIEEKDGYKRIENEGGAELGIASNSKVNVLTIDGYAFKDFLGNGQLLPYEDWRLSYEERARDLAARLSIEDIAGLMLYSAHQIIPAKGELAKVFGGTYDGKSFDESKVNPWDLTDQQKKQKMDGEKTVSIQWSNTFQEVDLVKLEEMPIMLIENMPFIQEIILRNI